MECVCRCRQRSAWHGREARVCVSRAGLSCGGERHGHDDADAAREALHDDDVKAVGVDELQEGQVVDVVEHPGAEAAAEYGEDQRRGHGAHDILADVHAALEESPAFFSGSSGEVRDGGGYVHGNIEHGAEAGEEDAGKEQLPDIDAGILPDEEQGFDVGDVVAGKVGHLAEYFG